VSVHSTQQQAIERAVAAVRKAGRGRVQVNGPREGDGDYEVHEAVCEPGVEPPPHVLVVYHPEARLLDGEWVCTRCGEGPPPAVPRPLS